MLKSPNKEGEIDIVGLRQFVAEAFGWKYKVGAKKLIRGLAPVLLVHKLRLRGDRRASGYNDPILTAINEIKLVRSICGKRAHFAIDGLPEIKVIFYLNDIAGLDIEAEEDVTRDYRRDGLAPLLEDDEVEAYVANNTIARSPERVWIAQTIIKVRVPLKVEDYEESLRNPKKLIRQKTKEKQVAVAKKVASKKLTVRGRMPTATDIFLQITNPVLEAPATSACYSLSKPLYSFS
ncbi:hypothetical protein DL95DRAFT_476158 [Leptodontidium sp. 2 PMI_412]|nr:hypothetical protein BKA61DRAFT_575415 [Leptodontidium sp. MPI-SDFR-AT-0119]KAH9209897.1 hypothetical protein DL95DRAFT_476158 [Leptodontidium sp. 2 PMI_412]